jgi:hypothetical protein
MYYNTSVSLSAWLSFVRLRPQAHEASGIRRDATQLSSICLLIAIQRASFWDSIDRHMCTLQRISMGGLLLQHIRESIRVSHDTMTAKYGVMIILTDMFVDIWDRGL